MSIKGILLVTVFLALGVGAGVMGGPVVARWMHPVPPPVQAGNFAKMLPVNGVRVVMYSLSTCPHCRDARAYFKARDIAYEDHVIDKSPKDMAAFEKMHESAVPVIFTAKHEVRGFSSSGLTHVLVQDGVLPASDQQKIR